VSDYFLLIYDELRLLKYQMRGELLYLGEEFGRG